MDFLADRLKGEKLSAEPAKAGYYQGCQRRNHRALGKGPKLDWEIYRDLVSRIEGLEVVQLRSKKCCLEDPVPIVEDALSTTLAFSI